MSCFTLRHYCISKYCIHYVCIYRIFIMSGPTFTVTKDCQTEQVISDTPIIITLKSPPARPKLSIFLNREGDNVMYDDPIQGFSAFM